MRDEGGAGEGGEVQGGGDLVGFRILDGAGPEEGVVLGGGEESDHGGGEEDVAYERRGFVVFGGEGYDEEEFDVALGEVKGCCIAGV